MHGVESFNTLKFVHYGQILTYLPLPLLRRASPFSLFMWTNALPDNGWSVQPKRVAVSNKTHIKYLYRCVYRIIQINTRLARLLFFTVCMVSFLFNAVFAMAILGLISRAHLASFVIMLPQQLKYSTLYCYFWHILICAWQCRLEIFHYLGFPHIHFRSLAVTILINLSTMSSSTDFVVRHSKYMGLSMSYKRVTETTSLFKLLKLTLKTGLPNL
jgi:hypothetical protein